VITLQSIKARQTELEEMIKKSNVFDKDNKKSSLLDESNLKDI
jgi:hypothetical protein